MILVRSCLAGALLLSTVTATGCDNSPTLPDGPITVTETFANLIALGGATSRSFVVRNAGDVTMKLVTLGVDSQEEVGMAIGTNNPQTGACSRDFTEVTSVAAARTISRRFEAGNYCATVYDAGKLTMSAAFTTTIEHQ